MMIVHFAIHYEFHVLFMAFWLLLACLSFLCMIELIKLLWCFKLNLFIIRLSNGLPKIVLLVRVIVMSCHFKVSLIHAFISSTLAVAPAVIKLRIFKI